MRFVNIGPAENIEVQLRRDTALAAWRVVARDGADIPPRLVDDRPALHRINVGETFDSEVSLPPGEYRLTVRRNPRFAFYDRRVIVR